MKLHLLSMPRRAGVWNRYMLELFNVSDSESSDISEHQSCAGELPCNRGMP